MSKRPVSSLCEQRFRLTKLCRFFAAGKCKRGSACTFAHDPNDLLPQLDLYKTSPCKFFSQQGSCRNGSSCRFAHSLQEFRGNTSQHDPAASGQEAQLFHPRAIDPRSELETQEMKYESATTHLPLGHVAQSWLSSSESAQTLTPREETENVSWTCKAHTTFLPLGESGRSPSFTTRAFNQDEFPSMRSNKPESCGKTCTCGFKKSCVCAAEPIKVLNLYMNFNTWDRSFQLHVCDSTCKHDVISRTDSIECEQLEISVKRTFIDVEVKTPNMRRSTSAPSLSSS